MSGFWIMKGFLQGWSFGGFQRFLSFSWLAAITQDCFCCFSGLAGKSWQLRYLFRRRTWREPSILSSSRTLSLGRMVAGCSLLSWYHCLLNLKVKSFWTVLWEWRERMTGSYRDVRHPMSNICPWKCRS